MQVFAPHSVGQDVAPAVIAVGGRVDGLAPNLTVYTIPVAVGFAAIEDIFDALVQRHPQAEWYFGNVYEADGVTPLNWWV